MYTNENELMHYGVMGMKWGIRRAFGSKPTSASDFERKKAAILKDNAKINKKLQKYERRSASQALRAAKLHKKAVRKIGSSSYNKLERKSAKAQLKAARLQKKVQKGKSLLQKNEKLVALMQKNLSDLK